MSKLFIVWGVVLIVASVAIIHVTSGNNKKITIANQQSYVALGDSVSAGVGLQNYSDSSACDRTNQSYPNIISSALHFALSNQSCSGATLTAGILGKQDVNNLLVASQIDQLYHKPRPSLISLTIGANDIGWTDFITKCYVSVCGSSDDSAFVDNKISTMTSNLQIALSDIQNNYKPQIPHVIVTGYHQVFPLLSANCTDLTGIDGAELTWGRQQQQSLNTAIANTVSNYTFARFAPINFTGHELCAADSWVQGLYDSAPYHPNQIGQQEYASQVIAAYRSFK